MSKTTKILKILYPDKVDVTDAIRISNTIVPLIDILVQTAAEPFIVDEPIQPIPAVLKPLKMADKLIIPHEPKTLPSKYPVFEECDKHQITSEWTESTFGKSKYSRFKDGVVITTNSCRIDTTWPGLNNYFDSLPKETIVMDLPGLSLKKGRELTNYYANHIGFKCHIANKLGCNVLVKDSVE